MANTQQTSNLGSEAGSGYSGEAILWGKPEASQFAGRLKPVRLERRRQFPCSFGQKRIWMLDHLEPKNPALHIAVRWRLEGTVSVVNLERAFQLIAARHEVLRTSFFEVDGEPVQHVEPSVPFHIKVVELFDLSEPPASTEAERLACLEALAPFNLRSAPPFIRVTVLRVADEVSILLLAAHQIVCDERSIRIIAREVCEIYAALQSGVLPVVPELPISYGEFCTSKSASISDAMQRSEAIFWQRTLSESKQFEVLSDKLRPPVLTSNGNILTLPLERRLVDGILDISRRHDCAFFVTTLASLLVLLHRYTGETDISVGTQIAGRDQVGSENLIGSFLNTLVLRNDLSGDLLFSDVLIRVHNTVREAFDHPNMPLEQLIGTLRPKRDRSRNPLFSVNYAVHESFADSASHGGLRMFDMLPLPSGTMYELNFQMTERQEGWHLSCGYNTDLYEAQTILRMLGHFRNLLRAVSVDPSSKISALPLLDSEERRIILEDWNQTEAFYPQHQGLSQLFEAQVARSPDAIAVICDGRMATYRQLDSASGQLAQLLRQRGLERGRCIGVLLNRTTDLVPALIAIHKAGCAYVPLDPRHPVERLKHIIADADLAALITDQDLDQKLLLEGTVIIQLKGADAASRERAQHPTSAPSAFEDLAYVIYTSGSTGKPKGVEITQRSLVNLLNSMAVRPGLAKSDVLLAVTTVSFDIAALELFLPLLVGARIVLATEEDVADGVRLKQLIERHGVTVMQATPASWRLLLEAGFCSRPGFKMLIGGEGLPRDLANRLLEGGGELWNMYGPTETTIWSSCAKIERGGNIITVGGPIANTQFYVLDDKGTPVPVGVPGFLYIGGDGVAKCYHNKPHLTAEKFIANGFIDGRIFLTGDLARWHSNGGIEILGRVDHQIKLRGFRIEPAEIEAVLTGDVDVAEAVVILGNDANGEGALWAYVVPRKSYMQSSVALIGRLRTSLGQALPRYMCPSSITLLDSIPQTPSGKIDRRSLPKPMMVDADVEESAMPLSEFERRLADIWGTVLGANITDKHANFFESGGHSLLAVRLLARIDAEFGRRFSLATLFKAPSLAEQASLLEHVDARDYDFRQVVRLQVGGTKQPLIAINNTGIYYTLSKRLGIDRPFTTLQLFDPSMPAESLPSSFEDIAAGYVQLIRRVQPDGPYALLGWCVAGSLAFEIAQQLCRSGQQVSQLVLVDTYVPGYLARLTTFQRMLADYSYRWKLIALDWSKVRAQRQTVGAFLGKRVIVKRFLKLLGTSSLDVEPDRKALGKEPMPEVYDQWLLNYLLEASERYEPRRYPGKIMLFRSAEEPSGRFLDFKMGWGQYASDGIEVIEAAGDHFVMFQDPSVSQMAHRISDALDQCTDQPVSQLTD